MVKVCRFFCRVALGAIVLGGMAQPLCADEATLAVAANFAPTMNRLAAEFEQDSGHKLRLAVGSSGKLYAQIKNGAPFHVLLSADQSTPARLVEDKLAIAESRCTYAVGALLLWSAKADFLNDSPAALEAGTFNKLALANPKLAPYGAAAVEVLEKMQLKDRTQKKWVMGENIAQTYQFVSSGNAELGFVALSQVMNEGKISAGSFWIVPKDLYQPIRQDMVLLNGGKNNLAAKAFAEFIRSAKAQTIITSYGYTQE